MFVHVAHKREEHNLLLGHEAVQAARSMLLSMLHSNPAICPTEVLAVYQTGYCNQLLCESETEIDIFICYGY